MTTPSSSGGSGTTTSVTAPTSTGSPGVTSVGQATSSSTPAPTSSSTGGGSSTSSTPVQNQTNDKTNEAIKGSDDVEQRGETKTAPAATQTIQSVAETLAPAPASAPAAVEAQVTQDPPAPSNQIQAVAADDTANTIKSAADVEVRGAAEAKVEVQSNGEIVIEE